MAVDAEMLAFLHAHGISARPEALSEMLGEAIEQLPAATCFADPRRELTVAEADVLAEGGFDLTPRRLGKRDPLARSVALYAGLLEDSWSVAEAAARLGVKDSRVRQRLTVERSLYGVKLGAGWRVPRFQFGGARPIPGIELVWPALPATLNPVAVLSWFTAAHPELEVEVQGGAGPVLISPREWLLSGRDPERVAAVAEDL